jgi:poly(hydroxyalkanoate) depolymerase family esterase
MNEGHHWFKQMRKTVKLLFGGDLPDLPESAFSLPAIGQSSFELPNAVFDKPPAPAKMPPGAHFMSGVYANEAGSRSYKLYVPSCWKGQALPLVVMLHGCAQDPDDFAAGTRMNAVAEERRCFVVYPAQSPDANNSRCWNWFNALDQKHGQGEPSIIAGITRDIIDTYPVARGQVYIAGMSAGGAMAVIVGTLYPELFAAVGVHSGLPFAAARDLPSALSAMKRGAPGAREAKSAGLPIIVFHGDQDTTVHPANGEELMAQNLRSHPLGTKALPSRLAGRVPDGHAYTRTKHWLNDGSPLAEHWVIHGAGHAWSGGSPAGSYTDGKGPDASREIMRFFATVRGG